MDINDLIRFQSNIQETLLAALSDAQRNKLSPVETLQLLSQEVTHTVLISKVASAEAKSLYKSA